MVKLFSTAQNFTKKRLSIADYDNIGRHRELGNPVVSGFLFCSDIMQYAYA